MGFSSILVVFFPYKPSIWGYPQLWKQPYLFWACYTPVSSAPCHTASSNYIDHNEFLSHSEAPSVQTQQTITTSIYTYIIYVYIYIIHNIHNIHNIYIYVHYIYVHVHYIYTLYVYTQYVYIYIVYTHCVCIYTLYIYTYYIYTHYVYIIYIYLRKKESFNDFSKRDLTADGF